MQTYQHSLKWITEDLNKNEELILEIMPLCPFCLTTNKARIMLFNKTPTKNTISGLLQNLINLQITAEDAKLFLKKHKLLKNTTPNQINKLAFTPIIDSLYDINGIVYPNNIINFINLEKNLVQRLSTVE